MEGIEGTSVGESEEKIFWFINGVVGIYLVGIVVVEVRVREVCVMFIVLVWVLDFC